MHHAPLYKNTYRIPSARRPGWNYSRAGHYFVTICTKDRICYFGKIIDQKMILSPIGHIIHNQWMRTGTLRLNIRLDIWVIMPNHFLGIVEIVNHIPETPQRGVSTGDNPHRRPEWSRGSLGAIINQFKSACTKQIRTMEHATFHWQPRFHDHAIRDEYELNRIRKYIRENPMKWDSDSLFSL